MRVLIICVCYNNVSDANKYIDSLSKSLILESGIKAIDLYLVNNGKKFSSDELNHFSEKGLLNIIVVENKANNGYFPGCLKGYKEALINKEYYDVMLVSNVDLEVADNFFNQLVLLMVKYEQYPVIIAPSIFSISESKDRNPKVITRFSKQMMKKYLFLYAIPYFHFLYKKTFYRLKRNIVNIPSETTIYAPHGSFIIFIGGIDLWSEFLNYPIFLFGEEIHIGEQALINNVPTYYHKELKIIDSDHASTGKENESFIRKNNYKAISYLLNRYW